MPRLWQTRLNALGPGLWCHITTCRGQCRANSNFNLAVLRSGSEKLSLNSSLGKYHL
jgi:hypothetical protein